MTFVESSTKAFQKRINCDNTKFCDKKACRGSFLFIEDPDLSVNTFHTFVQHRPPCLMPIPKTCGYLFSEKYFPTKLFSILKNSMNGRVPFGTGSRKAIKQRGALRGGWILPDSQYPPPLFFRPVFFPGVNWNVGCSVVNDL